MLGSHVIHHYGPDNATLTVQTRRGGAAAKAGHDLLLLVTRWEGTLEAGDHGPTAASLTADSTSLRVQRGEGGMMALSDDDKATLMTQLTRDPARPFESWDTFAQRWSLNDVEREGASGGGR